MLVGGLNWAYDLSGVGAGYAVQGTNIGIFLSIHKIFENLIFVQLMLPIPTIMLESKRPIDLPDLATLLAPIRL